jgi:hypothetical protein
MHMLTKLRGKISLFFVVFAVMLTIPAIALADNVQNDVVAGGNDTIIEGNSTTVNYRIAANNGDGQTGCNAADTSAATVTINKPAGVTATPGSLTFTSCATDKSVVFSSSTPGTYEIPVSVSDSGTGTYNTTPAKFTLHVLPAPPPSDTTPPVITPTVVGTLGENGWYTSNVTVSWIVQDGESTVSSKDGCGLTTISTDTDGKTVTCSATSAGGTSSESVTIKRDATDPINVAGTLARAADHNGWYNHSVGYQFDGDDATSGIASCTSGTYSGPDGTNLTVSGSCKDNAGNRSASVETAPFKYDETPPTNITFSGISGGDSFDFGDVPAQSSLDCSATDATSGFESCSIVSGYGTSVGNHTLTAKAFDQAGNSATKTLSYSVVAWRLSGFYQPVDMNDVVNTVKNGSTVPLKFEVFKQLAGTEFTNTGIVNQPLTAKQVSCTAFNGDPIDEIELQATGATALRYDSTAGQFIYNWQTPKKPGACYSVTVGTEGGSSIPFAHFKLK